MQAKCDYCGKTIHKYAGHINRAKKMGAGIYCDRKCAGLRRRTNETLEEKKVHKQWYDLFIRESMTEDEKIYKSFNALVLFHLDYQANPEKYRQERQRKMPAHVEYCRQPKYKKYKKEYDLNYRAKKDYGEFAEAAVVLFKLEDAIDVRLAKKENGLINKSQKRKRVWQKMQTKQAINSLLAI